MMKPIDDEKRAMKLESIKELLSMLKKSPLEKLPKGKGVSMMSVSVSKPKKEDEVEEGEEMSEFPEELMSSEEEGMEDSISEESSEIPEMSEEMSEEEEDEYQLPEPGVPEEIMELVKMMLQRKKEQ